MSWGKKSKKKTGVLTNFCFLVNSIRHTGCRAMVTRHTGSLSQLPVVEMSWGKKSKKKPSVLTNFHFLVNFIRHTGPMVTMVTRCTGSLSQLPVVKMSWGEKSKKKPSVPTKFYFMVNFIRHTGPIVTTGCSNVQPLISSAQWESALAVGGQLLFIHFISNFPSKYQFPPSLTGILRLY